MSRAHPVAGWREALAELPPHARVVIRCPSGSTLAALLLACYERELVSVPLHPRASDAEAAGIAERVSASLVVDGRADPVTCTPLPCGRPDHPDAAGLAIIMFTSGSTGRPKGVMQDRAAVAGNALATADLHGFAADRPHGTCLPLFHCNAIMMSLFGTYLRGTPLVLCERFDPTGYFAALDAGGATTASVVPAMLADLVEVAPPWPERLEYLITAAAPLSSELAGRFHDLYGPRLRQGYGLSEAVNFSFVMPRLDSPAFLEQYVSAHPPVGVPLPGTEYRLEDGEVWIRSADLMRGYWEDTDATAAALTGDGWLRTGDLGEVRDGYLVLRGRRSEVLNRGGEKYHPVDVEARWREAGMTGRFAAVPVAEPGLGHEAGLFAEDATVGQVRALCETAAPRPAAVQLGRFHTTSTGKPRRTFMGARLAARRESARRYQSLLDHASAAADAIVRSPRRPACAQATHVHAQALALTAAHPRPATPPAGPRTVAHDALDALVEHWPDLASDDGGGGGERMMRANRGLWKRFMTEWPMVRYAELMADTLAAGGFLDGRVLEVGSGVGNTTALIEKEVRGEFVWSDRSADLVARGTWAGTGAVLDFDEEPPGGLGTFDTVLATNAVHCSADPARAVRRLRSLLADGGRLVLAEGSNPTDAAGTPWALNFWFSAMDGWWDRSGFRTRWEWLSMFEAAGMRDLGFSALRAGRHDLGGVVWATR